MSWITNDPFPYRIQMQENILECQSPKTSMSLQWPCTSNQWKRPIEIRRRWSYSLRIFILYSLSYFLYLFPSLALVPPLSYFLKELASHRPATSFRRLTAVTRCACSDRFMYWTAATSETRHIAFRLHSKRRRTDQHDSSVYSERSGKVGKPLTDPGEINFQSIIAVLWNRMGLVCCEP